MDENLFAWEVLKKIAELPIGKWMGKVEKVVGRQYGLIHKSAAAEIHGIKGFLIWDYIIYNEITFKDNDENIVSLYRGFSDKETEDMWNELVKKHGV